MGQHNSTEYQNYLPTITTLQVGGGVGLISGGLGWEFGDKWSHNAEILGGYLPKFESDNSHFILTAKYTASPFTLKLNNTISFEALTFGLFVTRIYGDGYWITEPSQFPDDYFDLATGVRANIFIGERINFALKNKGLVEQIGLYYELNVNEMFIVSDTQSSHINVFDHMNISFGAKLKMNYAKILSPSKQ